MKFVTNINNIITNIKTLESYLSTDNEVKKDFAESLVKKDRTILVYKVKGQNHFAPSRFSSYIDNTMEQHEVNDEKDGRDINPVIDSIVGHAFINDKIECKFIDYCAKLGVVPANVNRRYWRLIDGEGKYLNIDI